MKRIIIISMMFLSIYCTAESCINETDPSQCQKHTLEQKFKYYSCSKYENEDFPDIKQKCTLYFTNEELQKLHYKYQVGRFKEWATMNDGNAAITYVKGDTVHLKEMEIEDVLTKEDEKIFFGKNNCWYKAYARFYNDYEGERYINISDKNVCYNVDRFEDLKDIMDCGYATIKGKYKNNSFVLTTCAYILDKNVDELFKDVYKNEQLSHDILYYFNHVVHSFLEMAKYNISTNFHRDDVQDYEISIEDRYGNIVTYNINAEIIGGDDSEDGEDNPQKILDSSSRNIRNTLDILFVLYFILFLI